LETHGQAYVLRVTSSFCITLAHGVTLTRAEVVTRLLNDARRWEVRSAGPGSKGQRWYAWARLATASPQHHLLIRRHLASGESRSRWHHRRARLACHATPTLATPGGMVTGGLHVTKAVWVPKISAPRYADRRAVGVKGL
jgi:hypothetical protein